MIAEADAESLLLAARSATRRVARVRVAGRDAWIAVEDAALYRDALGVVAAAGHRGGVPGSSRGRRCIALLARCARTHGPFTTADVAARFGIVPSQAHLALERAGSR